ncbi:hypothetical protein Mgra_00009897 [Meloidogyne graminicola]|uniref:Uncharacterized protein n=1 Tax=Meloidogyne graminicola TaxID=189291 RepID=A0A8S9ZBN6_9BILA|nr:hypothetical protein Mgra_00009897 [Meloidogyne graminicola]
MYLLTINKNKKFFNNKRIYQKREQYFNFNSNVHITIYLFLSHKIAKFRNFAKKKEMKDYEAEENMKIRNHTYILYVQYIVISIRYFFEILNIKLILLIFIIYIIIIIIFKNTSKFLYQNIFIFNSCKTPKVRKKKLRTKAKGLKKENFVKLNKQYCEELKIPLFFFSPLF